MFHERWLPQCAICQIAVSLEECKTDECGQAVHEDRYVQAMVGHEPLAGLGLFPAQQVSNHLCFVRF
jgi:hypothetical protein